MNSTYNLDRFLTAQESVYSEALGEIKRGKKTGHWMWFIFPQIEGLGLSSISVFYSIKSKEEAIAFLNHRILGVRLVEISQALLAHKGKTALDIFGSPDDMKLKSCMTLFSLITDEASVFQQVLNIYFNGKSDDRTARILKLKEYNP